MRGKIRLSNEAISQLNEMTENVEQIDKKTELLTKRAERLARISDVSFQKMEPKRSREEKVVKKSRPWWKNLNCCAAPNPKED